MTPHISDIFLYSAEIFAMFVSACMSGSLWYFVINHNHYLVLTIPELYSILCYNPDISIKHMLESYN